MIFNGRVDGASSFEINFRLQVEHLLCKHLGLVFFVLSLWILFFNHGRFKRLLGQSVLVHFHVLKEIRFIDAYIELVFDELLEILCIAALTLLDLFEHELPVFNVAPCPLLIAQQFLSFKCKLHLELSLSLLL